MDKFLLELLEDDTYTSYIHWTCKEKKEFKIVNPGQVSNLWGNIRGKKKFTADKLYRELRNLRKKRILEKLERKDHFILLKN